MFDRRVQHDLPAVACRRRSWRSRMTRKCHLQQKHRSAHLEMVPKLDHDGSADPGIRVGVPGVRCGAGHDVRAYVLIELLANIGGTTSVTLNSVLMHGGLGGHYRRVSRRSRDAALHIAFSQRRCLSAVAYPIPRRSECCADRHLSKGRNRLSNYII